MIPKKIHFIWIGSDLPAWASRNIHEFRRLNPDHEILIHTEDKAPERYAGVYRQTDHPSTRSDLLRLAILREHGGWYFDVDYWPLRPLEDVERAFQLDGTKLFCAWMNNPRINNGVLACQPGCAALDALDEYIFAGGIKHGQSRRTQFGPPVITKLAEDRPDQVRVAGWPWFNGVKDVHAGKVRRRCLSQKDSQKNAGNEFMLNWIPETGGQMPFAFHLWAHTHTSQIEVTENKAYYTAGEENDRLIVVFGKRMKDAENDSDRPYRAIADAAAKLGFRAEVIPYDEKHPLDRCSGIPEAAFVWNGLKDGRHKSNTEDARAMGAKCLFLEFGFFDRNNHFQCDHEGFLHRSSWRRNMAIPAPDGSQKRLKKYVPEIQPMKPRDGYVLVLGQVTGDSQMMDSEIQGPVPLQRLIKRALPNGVPAYFRPHPEQSKLKAHPNHETLPRLPGQEEERDAYIQNRHGTGLAAALAGAKFVVTINSNAIVEALIMGVPCLAFGPSLAIDAAAVHETSCKTLKMDMQAMIAGWQPEPEHVRNYLQWLAARQWSVDEFSDPDVIRSLLEDAGVEVQK